MDDGTPDDALGRFLTIADTAQLLNVTASEAYALVRSGELPAIRVGSSWRVERDVLESYIEAMYEATRRLNLWHQSEFADLSEPTFGAPRGS